VGWRAAALGETTVRGGGGGGVTAPGQTTLCVLLVSGTLPVVRELECAIARFVGKQDAIVFGMGFATNSTNMRALVSKVRL